MMNLTPAEWQSTAFDLRIAADKYDQVAAALTTDLQLVSAPARTMITQLARQAARSRALADRIEQDGGQ